MTASIKDVTRTLYMGQNFPALKVGILGGGQLARMLALQAHNLGVQPWVLSPSRQDPAAQVTQHWIEGSPQSAPDLKSFFPQVDVLTFESEFLDAEMLAQLGTQTQRPIYPQPQTMGLLQDRLTQKQLLIQYGLPTAPFIPVQNAEEAEAALTKFGGEMILKQRRMGYDGYGTFPISSREELIAIKSHIEENSYGFIAEPRIHFRRELAVMAARSRGGKHVILPLVETHQSQSRCLWVNGPVKTRAMTSLTPKLLRFLKRLEYVGIMGFELFDTSRGLLINELAPRVHNSGHYSLEALGEDQFTVHLKAILNLPFNPIALTSPGFAMMNLLGEDAGEVSWELPPNIHLHWYGKDQSRPGRKMGHYTVLGGTPRAALTLAKKFRRNFKI